eukprot:6197564-Pleurochrysis_carterae.AAC.2
MNENNHCEKAETGELTEPGTSLLNATVKVTSSKPLVCRTGCDLSTSKCGELPPGECFVVLEVVANNEGTRVRTEKGWVSAVTREGKVMLSKVQPVTEHIAKLAVTKERNEQNAYVGVAKQMVVQSKDSSLADGRQAWAKSAKTVEKLLHRVSSRGGIRCCVGV